MSFVTTVCAAAAVGSPVPPDPCAHSGAATKHATITVAHHRAQCVIPTSVEGPTTYSPAPSENPKYMLRPGAGSTCTWDRSEEHTSELQSLAYLVCRLLLEKKKKKKLKIAMTVCIISN